MKIKVWDTAGQERFHVITRTYYKGAHGIGLIYDVTDADSFKNVNYWMTNITQHADEKVSATRMSSISRELLVSDFVIADDNCFWFMTVHYHTVPPLL